ncbi:hypothetical protein ACFUVV_29550 [Streptomyces sp. NPDC057376]|uniref:DUF3885 domain-containing protein n=1 Tax=unclassified Streptomyces TaxID=2593676 RepID=UPI00093D59BB|nr:hypothetical protein [Streptomyces sp. CB02414]OKI88124.1 hypothetical protein AMK11_08025 [Streptomyces sp. CB02414]
MTITSPSLAVLWRDLRPSGPPVAHTFRSGYADRWVRFHTLPGSKRYPETAGEYATVLERHNAILDELFPGTDVFVVTADWAATADGPAHHPEPRRTLHADGIHWWTDSDTADPDPDFHVHMRLYADRRPWRPGCVDELLRAVADDRLAEVFLTDTGLRRIHHPYDGGADVVLATPAERDRFANRYVEWLPT